MPQNTSPNVFPLKHLLPREIPIESHRKRITKSEHDGKSHKRISHRFEYKSTDSVSDMRRQRIGNSTAQQTVECFLERQKSKFISRNSVLCPPHLWGYLKWKFCPHASWQLSEEGCHPSCRRSVWEGGRENLHCILWSFMNAEVITQMCKLMSGNCSLYVRVTPWHTYAWHTHTYTHAHTQSNVLHNLQTPLSLYRPFPHHQFCLFCSISRTMVALRTMFGQNIPEPIEAKRSDWSQNPDFLMSYTNWPVGMCDICVRENSGL